MRKVYEKNKKRMCLVLMYVLANLAKLTKNHTFRINNLIDFAIQIIMMKIGILRLWSGDILEVIE